MVELLRQGTPAFIPPDIWPANSPDLNPVDYSICGCVQQRIYPKPVNDVGQLKQRLMRSGLAYSRLLSVRRLTIGDVVLCPCRRTLFWTFVVISTVACLLLIFARWMAKHVTTVVVSCYSECSGPGFLTHNVEESITRLRTDHLTATSIVV